MKVAFVSGPYGAEDAVIKRDQIRRAEALARHLWARGFAVICPHTNSGWFDGVAPEPGFLAGYLELLRRADFVVTVDGWRNSHGARAEVTEALSRDIPVYHSLETALRAESAQLSLPFDAA